MPDYKITVSLDSDSKAERLVRAKNQAAAIAHVVKDSVQIDKASADEIIRLTKAGVEVEIAA